MIDETKEEWYVVKHRLGFYIPTRFPNNGVNGDKNNIITTKPLTRMDARRFIHMLLKLKVY